VVAVSTSVTGRVVNESSAGITGLVVVVRDETVLFPSDLGHATTDGNGTYTIPVTADFGAEEWGPRDLTLYVRTGVLVKDVPMGRVLYSKAYPDSGTGDTLTVPDISLKAADVTGWPVSLPGLGNALPVQAGNALRPLVDNKLAWQHLADSMRAAQSEINIMQLEFDLPSGGYNADATQESPEIVLAFPDGFDGNSGTTTANDPQTFPRPERLLLDAATAGKTVRAMLPKCGNIIGGLLFAKGAGKLQDYFTAASSKAKTLTFTTQGSSVIHAKAALIDAVADAASPEAIIIGSPFAQSYYDSSDHAVFEARRGSCSGEPIPVHDVTVGIRGPVVADVQAQFAAHWNLQCQPADKMQPLSPAPAAITTAGDGEYLASAQLVRSVNYDTLPGLPNGEQGVLEAYLRAIEKATSYIYMENQYFTDQAIGDALIGALVNQPKLQVILLLNIDADLPFYPTWQAHLIGRIRDGAGPAASRLGVFTSWSHTGPDTTHHRKEPVVIPNYMHTKTAIVDGKWATVGSGNLDGASLDEFQLLYPLLGKNRNDELNLLVFNDSPDPQTDFVDQLRLSLWSEHLGLATDDPQLSAATLSAGDGGWLKLWTDQATAKLQGLISDPSTVNPCHVLAFPPDAPLLFNPTALPFGIGAHLAYFDFHHYLTQSKINGTPVDMKNIDLDATTTSFDFHTGKWSDA
jgi:phosphatidylserine/phosphatidylglycerophosphate/cardiolipin synthase-like enzyme